MATIQQRYNKVQVIDELASQNGLHRNHIDALLDELGVLIYRHLSPALSANFYSAGW